MHLAVIGGTGVDVTRLLDDVRSITVSTKHGEVQLEVGSHDGTEVAFLHRHGGGHTVPPHRVNYRANIAALHRVGVRRTIATAAVGAVADHLPPGTLVLLRDFIDLTRGRPSTYHEGGPDGVVHIDVTDPYCDELASILLSAAGETGIALRDGAVYACTEGPRFETAAEVRMIATLGGEVVGMTGVPEVVLARELGLCYASVAMVTNVAAGLRPQPLGHEEVLEAQRDNAARFSALLDTALDRVPTDRSCGCER